MVAALLLSALLTGPGPFVLVNGTPGVLAGISIREATGAGEWKPLGPGRLSPAARGTVPALGGDHCAFDVRAQTEGREILWRDVNLCDARTVTLNRRADGTLWADYD